VIEDGSTGEMARPAPLPMWKRVLGVLRPSRAHTASTATILLMISTLVSSLIGLVRTKYIAYLFGSSMDADAFNAAFVLPDMILYFLVGGAASVTFVTMLTRYRNAGREAEAERSLSVILTTMLLVLGSAIVLAEILAPYYVKWWFDGFSPEKIALCVRLTRILLPGPLFFFAGGLLGSVLLVRKQFTIQAITPLIYNLGTIIGGLLLVKKIGVSSLALGTTAGAFCGPFLLNWIFVRRAGTRIQPMLSWKDDGLREWVKLSLPLIVGVSLVTADSWIISHFASSTNGAISLLNYAKRLFAAPYAMLAQAAGAATMPFFASLWSKGKRFEFATGVADSVSRVVSIGFLLASGLMAMALPLVDLLFRGGRFSRGDAGGFAVYFSIFCLSMFLWSAQTIYARAFYAAGNTFTPMVAGTIVTIVSLPIYAGLFHWQGATGLAIASDIGITLQTVTLALLLHQRRMVSLASLDYEEMGRCLLAAVAAGGAVWLVFSLGMRVLMHALHRSAGATSRLGDLMVLVAGSALWVAVAWLVLERMGSALPRVVWKRLGLAR
jgi:putative peptidoglycan lipid II flippase